MPVLELDFTLNLPEASSWYPERYAKISVRHWLDGFFYLLI